MPEDNGAPKPGHFLPGGAGANASEPDRRKPVQPSLGQARDVGTQGGWHAQQVPPQRPRRRPALIAGIVAGALVVVGGIVFASSKLVSGFDSVANQPISGRTIDPAEQPGLADPSPTVTIRGPKPPSDTQVVRQNKLYAATLTASCAEPSALPVNQTGVAQYLNGVLACLNKAWAPVIRRTGNEFRAPKLVLFAQGDTTCDDEPDDLAVYCHDEETVNFPWDRYTDGFDDSPSATRIRMLGDVTGLYGYHVLNLVQIDEAESGLIAAASGDAAADQLRRRYSLQGDCLGAAFVGAIRGSFPLRGRLLDRWKVYMSSLVPSDPKTDGSAKSSTLWMRRGFDGRLKACNTWTAPAKEVS